ncbi:MAG TPA: ThuA domain-containing protein, partial [Bacteroidales bacterium]|nr:ThuA domain-containing protein [Bacteroidales bacterium]
MKKIYLLLVLAAFISFLPSCKNGSQYKTLIITGQSNHDWKTSSPALKQILEETGLFSCDIAITPEKGGDMKSFKPDFSKYKLVLMDYVGDSWSDKTKADFVKYVTDGGGVVVYHESCMAFPDWKEYNEIIGLSGWGNRNEKDGPYMYYKNNRLVVDTTAGPAGSHGKSREFVVRKRNADHPVMKGIPSKWMHGNDELYSQLRGWGKNLEILATAYADTVPGGGTRRDEPMLMAVTFGKGRVFSTVMGHAGEDGGPAMHCTGFIVTLQRGAEWAASGNVTQKVPFDFPSAAGVVTRPDYKELTLNQAMENIAGYDIAKSTRNLACLQSYIRNVSGDKEKLSEAEHMMINVLKNEQATVESKK